MDIAIYLICGASVLTNFILFGVSRDLLRKVRAYDRLTDFTLEMLKMHYSKEEIEENLEKELKKDEV